MKTNTYILIVLAFKLIINAADAIKLAENY